ncbi:GAF domain-containing protein [Pararoseomonas sp. SCSIO 73927]|uniref:GAF domain-containing protein n=1 Tax=Pararoseomonas sp. SCSIO 73927 TaxID=3114537 RepID=UPI0030CCEDDE
MPQDEGRDDSPETPGRGVINVRIEVLTPQQAGDLLARRRAGARLNASAIDMYRLAMLDGRWIFNGATIIVSRSGVLLDGVQRIAACVSAGVPLTTVLARGVDEEVLPTIDQRRRRQFAAVLAAHGVPNARAQAALTERLIRYDEGTLLAGPEATPDWGRMESALRANPGIEAAVAASLATAHSPLPEPVRSAILYMGREVDWSLTMRLLEALRQPDRFDSSEPGVVLRAEIDRLQGDPAARPDRVRLLALSIKALNALLRHERPRRIVWHGDSGPAPEEFPRLQGYPGLAPAGAGPSLARPAEASPVPEGVTLGVEVITPGEAARDLRAGGPGSTPSRNSVDAITRDIATGRWKLNAQPICFSGTGRLLDGHHRLMAVVAANTPIPVLVVRGLSDVAAGTYDRHTPRSSAVRHPLGSFGDAALAAAMANLLWRREHRNPTVRAKKATPAEVQQILEEHPRLLALRGFGRRMIDFGRASVMGYAAYVIEREHPAKAAFFLRAIETGANLAEGHPVLALRDQMQRLRREQATQDEQFEAFMEGWQRFKAYQPEDAAPEQPLAALRPERPAQRGGPAVAGAFPRPADLPASVPGPPRAAPANAPPDPGRALRQQSLLASFSRFALRSGQLPAVLQEAARLAAEGSGAPLSRILRYEARTGTLLLIESAGWKAEGGAQVHIPLDSRFPAGQAFIGGRSVLHPRPGGEGRAALPSFLLDQGVRRGVDVVIPGRVSPFGVLGVDDTSTGYFTAGDIAFLEALAGVLGLSIEAAREVPRR